MRVVKFLSKVVTIYTEKKNMIIKTIIDMVNHLISD